MLELIAANLPILICFVIGIGLLILEAFMPGFGAPGITGIVLEVITLVMTWFEHGPIATLAMLLIVLLVLAIAFVSKFHMPKVKLKYVVVIAFVGLGMILLSLHLRGVI